jgi:hypothetical protein
VAHTVPLQRFDEVCDCAHVEVRFLELGTRVIYGRTMRTATFVIACGLAACVPHRDYPPAQIDKLAKLDEVMDVQATIADPQFKKVGQESFSDADWAGFADVAARLQVTSKKIHQFSKGPGFDKLADDLHAKAEQLGTTSAAKDVKATSDALASIKATCKECHSKFK